MRAHPYMTRRKGSQNLYYKRPVPVDLQVEGRPKQIWKSLGDSDPKKVKVAYRTVDAETDALFEAWRKEAAESVAAEPTDDTSCKMRSGYAQIHPATALTPALLRQLADAHYRNVYENDFALRSGLWAKAEKDQSAFWRGDVIKFPKSYLNGPSGLNRTYEKYLEERPTVEGVFLYAMFAHRNERINELNKDYRVGATQRHNATADALLKRFGLTASDGERVRLIRKLIEVEIKALNDLRLGDEASFDETLEREVEAKRVAAEPKPTKPGSRASDLVETYVDDAIEERDWPKKTELRVRAALREFFEIAGDKPINTYEQADGVRFKDVQCALPNNRQVAQFKGLSLVKAAEKARQLKDAGSHVARLNRSTVKDKIGIVSLFFDWARSRDASVSNPLADQQIRVNRKKNQKAKRHPWTVDELNRMLAAPIYVGCRSEYYWKEPGELKLRQSAKFWVPLIALFTGMRLGEIIQLHVADVKTIDNIKYFDVTPVAVDPNDDEAADFEGENEKSVKTISSRRGIPIHKTLSDLGFEQFLEYRRNSKSVRLFPDFEKAEDDGSWSKHFSKHFKRFRDSIGITRKGVKFHSFRHNVEDALRNADGVSKEVRDAIQGHGENGISREYGTGYYVMTLNAAVQKIAYIGLNLDALVTSYRAKQQ